MTLRPADGAREMRASWRRLLFFFVCVAIGVGAIVALRSVIQTVRDGLTREARALIGADVVVGTNRRGPPRLRAAHRARLADGASRRAPGDHRVATMVRPAGGTGARRADGGTARRQAGFPFYGRSC